MRIVRIIVEIVEQTNPALLPFPLAGLAVSLIWFWVRVDLGIPADTPLFHNRYWIFGDGLAMALGIGGIVFVLLCVVGVVLGIARWVKDLFD